jgi:hypothetical protein
MIARTIAGTVAAFPCGAVLAFVAIASMPGVRAAGAKTIHTCAAADGMLRVTDSAVPCGPEERRVRLTLPAATERDCKAEDGRMERAARRLRDLEARARRGTLGGRRMVAPFEVITTNKKRLLKIEEQHVTLYNRDLKPVVWIVSEPSGGLLQVQTVDGERSLTVSALDRRAHLLIQEEEGRDRIHVGRRANGRYGLLVSEKGGQVVARLGQSENGSGLAEVAGTGGIPAATLRVDVNKGLLTVSNAKGANVASLSASGTGGAGHLVLHDAAGTTMVESGVTPDGAGVVRTGPGMRHSGVGIVGLVPSFILGKPR